MRLVSLSPSLTDILTALQAGDLLVGVSHACDFSQNSLQRLGNPKAVQISKIFALAPDMILADAEDNRPDEIQRLQSRWRIKLFEVRKPSQVLDVVAVLGRLVRKEKEAECLNEALRQELLANERVFQEGRRKRTIVLTWDQPYLTVNFDTYPSRLVESCGGRNVFREETIREFPVEMEEMIEKNPETLLLAGDPAPFCQAHIARFRQYRIFSRIPIHLVPGKFLNRYGPQTLEALRYLRELYFHLASPAVSP